MVTQGANNASILHQMKKTFKKYPITFCIEGFKTYDQIINKIIMC